MADNKWLTVGSVRKSQKGGHYLKVTEDVTLKKGDVLQLQDPRLKLKELVARGFVKAEDAAKREIPEYVKYDVVLPPKQVKA